MRRAAWVPLLLLSHVGFAATVTEVHYVMGTYFRVTAEHRDAEAARTAMRRCFATTRDLERRFSRFDPTSELSQLNASDTRAVTVSNDMAALLQRALQLQRATGGRFAVGIGSLTALWRTATEWPTAAQLAAARAAGDGDALHLRHRTLIRQPGARIDLDGVAKGFAVDRCAAQLRDAGIRRAWLSFGESSLYALGAPAGTHGWTVTVRSLDAEHALGTLTLRDQAASISAVFGHERQIGSRRVGHIVNPQTGEPLTAPAIAVVVAASATDAEAFSKAVLIGAPLDTPPKEGGYSGRTVLIEALHKRPRSSRVGPVLSGAVSRDHAGTATLDSTGATTSWEHFISGALLIRPGGIRRTGTIAFTKFSHPRRIAAAAEPLR